MPASRPDKFSFKPKHSVRDIKSCAERAVEKFQQLYPLKDLIHYSECPMSFSVALSISTFELESYSLNHPDLPRAIAAYQTFEDFLELCEPPFLERIGEPAFLSQVLYLREIYPEHCPNGQAVDTDFIWFARLLFELDPARADRYFLMRMNRPD